MNGFGTITWWGFSPALDFQDKVNIDEGDINILMIGAGDVRHILKTVSEAHRHNKKQINIYIVENTMEVFCRHMLLLNLFAEPFNIVGLQEKTELFLEIFGNTLIRNQTKDYLEKKANEFIKMVTDLNYQDEKMPFLDLSRLKFKERDRMERIFKVWRDAKCNTIEFSKLWDFRVRQYLGTRYDSKEGAFDWDYSMKLMEKNAGIVNGINYKTWRRSGIAFCFRDSNYNLPNKTLLSGFVFHQNGERLLRYGYWGDIVTSPYISFGIECEDKSFFIQQNKIYRKTAQDVSYRNITALIYEAATQRIYDPSKICNDQTDVKEKIQDIGSQLAQYVRITFLPLDILTSIFNKALYQKLFNLIYIANSMAHLLKDDLTKTFADESVVIIETSKYILDVRPEQQKQLMEIIINNAKQIGCQVQDPFDIETHSFIKLNFKRC